MSTLYSKYLITIVFWVTILQGIVKPCLVNILAKHYEKSTWWYLLKLKKYKCNKHKKMKRNLPTNCSQTSAVYFLQTSCWKTFPTNYTTSKITSELLIDNLKLHGQFPKFGLRASGGQWHPGDGESKPSRP